MANTKIKSTILAQLRKDRDFQASMVKNWGVSIRTVERWIDDGAEKLTTPVSMQLIKKFTGLPQDQILEKTSA